MDIHAHNKKVLVYKRIFMGFMLANILLGLLMHIFGAVVVDHVADGFMEEMERISEQKRTTPMSVNKMKGYPGEETVYLTRSNMVRTRYGFEMNRRDAGELVRTFREHHVPEIVKGISHWLFMYGGLLTAAIGSLVLYGAHREYRLPVAVHAVWLTLSAAGTLTWLFLGCAFAVIPLVYKALQIFVSFVLLELLRVKSHYFKYTGAASAAAHAGPSTSAMNMGPPTYFGPTITEKEKTSEKAVTP